MAEERRRFSRVRFQSGCSVTFGERQFSGSLADISLKGALLSFFEKLPAGRGDSCRFEMSLGGTEIVLSLDANVVFTTKERIGIRFGAVDLESMIHLRRLMELNIGDATKVQKELFLMMASRR